MVGSGMSTAAPALLAAAGSTSDVDAEMHRVTDGIASVEGEINIVKAKIDAMEESLRAANVPDLQWIDNKRLELLMRKEEQLMRDKEQLRREKELLMEKEARLSERQQATGELVKTLKAILHTCLTSC